MLWKVNFIVDMVVCMTHISFKGIGISYSRTIVYVCFQYYRN